MDILLMFSIILLGGLFLGEISKKLFLPKITGYLISGVIYSNFFPSIFTDNFIEHADVLIELGLSFIAFEIGSQLSKEKIAKLGKIVAWITLFESLFSFIFVSIGIGTTLYLFFDMPISMIIPTALILGALSAPTDPATTLAISQENHSKGPVSSTILGITALDDLLGIFLFIITVPISQLLLSPTDQSLSSACIEFLQITFNSIFIGLSLGMLSKLFYTFIEKKSDGTLVILLFGILTFITGIRIMIHIDTVITTLVLGCFIRNFVPNQKRLFTLMERYSEELVFLLFFSISGLHLKLTMFGHVTLLIIVFTISRTLGKYIGSITGATLSNASPMIKKFIFGGLIPQGGVVIGLALSIKQNPNFNQISELIFEVTLGSTIILELIGPILSFWTLKKSGEIK